MNPEGTFIHRLEYFLLKLALGLFGVMNIDRASAAGGRLARFLGPKFGISNRARRNIRLAMPELSDTDVEKILIGMWENLGRTIAEYAHLDTFLKPEEQHRLQLEDVDALRIINTTGRGGVFVSGHFSNWELLPVIMSLEGLKGGVVYRHANNPLVNDWMIALRDRLTDGAVQIPKGNAGARLILRLMRKHGFIAMLIDQKMNDGLSASLFNQPAMTTSAPAGLAIRYNVPIIPTYIERVEGAHFRVKLYDAIIAEEGAEPFAETVRITQEINDFLEQRIRERPQEWFWLHDRWTPPPPRRMKKITEAKKLKAELSRQQHEKKMQEENQDEQER